MTASTSNCTSIERRHVQRRDFNMFPLRHSKLWFQRPSWSKYTMYERLVLSAWIVNITIALICGVLARACKWMTWEGLPTLDHTLLRTWCAMTTTSIVDLSYETSSEGFGSKTNVDHEETVSSYHSDKEASDNYLTDGTLNASQYSLPVETPLPSLTISGSNSPSNSIPTSTEYACPALAPCQKVITPCPRLPLSRTQTQRT